MSGNGFVMESVNTVIAVYKKSNHALVNGPTAVNQFLGLSPEINRVTGVAGDFTSDPKCYSIRRSIAGSSPCCRKIRLRRCVSHTYIAVSKTADPTRKWTIYKLDMTNDGVNGTLAIQLPVPGRPAAHRRGQQRLLRHDQLVPERSPGFNGAQIYAMSKLKLAVAATHSGSTPHVVHIDASQDLVPFGGLSYSIQPATTPILGNLAQ